MELDNPQHLAKEVSFLRSMLREANQIKNIYIYSLGMMASPYYQLGIQYFF